MSLVVTAPKAATVPVDGTDDLFPVHRIYCVGRNYAAHAREMGHDPNREPPFFFLKPADTILLPGQDMAYPGRTSNLHHEIELVVALSSGGTDIAEADALDHVYGYAVGLDMTRRDLQGAAKDAGRPWEAGKSFEQSAPISKIVPAAKIGHPNTGRIWLEVNGKVVQDADLADLIWNVPESIAYLSTLFELQAGDLIYSGTPAGVGPVVAGDVMTGGVDGVGEIKVKVV